MAPNLEAFLAALSTTLLDGIVMYLICCVAIAEKATLKSCACFIGCIVFLESLFMPLLGTGYSGLSYLLCFILTMLQSRFAFFKRGPAFWACTGINLLAQFGLVIVVAPVSLMLFGDERANAIILSQGWDRLLQSCVNLGVSVPYAALIWDIRRLLRRLPTRLSDLLYLSRAFLLLTAAFCCAFMLLNQLSPLVASTRLHSAIALLSVILLMVLVCLSYLIQDFRYLKMRRSNNTLERQKLITETLIADTRQFRHNMLNMIYGFEGALLSDNPQVSAAYYRHLASKCAMMNHENISALHLLDNPQLETQLLAKIQQANQQDIPLYLSVHGPLPSKAALLSRISEALELLVSGAINAAVSQEGIHLSIHVQDGYVRLRLLAGGSAEAAARIEDSLRRLPGSAHPLYVGIEQLGRYTQQTVVLH